MHLLQALAWKHKSVVLVGSGGVALIALIYRYVVLGQKKSEKQQLSKHPAQTTQSEETSKASSSPPSPNPPTQPVQTTQSEETSKASSSPPSPNPPKQPVQTTQPKETSKASSSPSPDPPTQPAQTTQSKETSKASSPPSPNPPTQPAQTTQSEKTSKTLNPPSPNPPKHPVQTTQSKGESKASSSSSNSALNTNSPAKKDPLQPEVKLESTLNIAKLSMKAPKGFAPNVVLIFCIDTSASMKGERLEAVKRVLNKILRDAQEVIKASIENTISIAIFSFDDHVKTVVDQTKITSDDNQIKKIASFIEKLESKGETDLYGGLDVASKNLQNITASQASCTFILLTDGGATVDYWELRDANNVMLTQLGQQPSESSTVMRNKLKARGITFTSRQILPQCYQRLASVKARLFCIGVGKEHDREILEKIVNQRPAGIEGTYIDATDEANCVAEKAIERIYKQSMAWCHEITLTSSLKAKTWYVEKLGSSLQRDQVLLGDLQAGEQLVKFIKIDPAKLVIPLELLKVKFELTFKDHQNNLHKIPLHWNPNTQIDPSIIAELEAAT